MVSGPGTCSFPSTLTNYACEGLERNPNRFNHTDCRMACCYNPSCEPLALGLPLSLDWDHF